MKSQQLRDSYGRPVRYLRISLTEVCNYRCVYCTPAEGLSVIPSSNYLTRSEITRFVQIAGQVGIHRIRLTGGEPLLRNDITDIIRSLKQIETVRDLSLTTNGSQLSAMVTELKDAGLDRINISLDSMEEERFQSITRVDECRKVMQSVFDALKAGFPVKLNMVILQGLQRDEILQFVGLAKDYPLEVRFLEFMPLCGTEWSADRVLPIKEVRDIIKEHFDLEELPREDDVAQTFKIINGKGRVGFIASLTESFCDQCSRIRLTADGKIRPCLFSDAEVPIKDLLRQNASDERILEALYIAAAIKPKGNRFRERPFEAEGENNDGLETTPMIRKIGG